MPVKNVELAFSGLCSFLNVRDNNNSMPEPSVILVRTDNELPPNTHPPGMDMGGTDMDGGDHPGGPARLVPHTSFLAFDSKTIRVDDASGFVRVPDKPNFWSLTLSGVLIKIKDDSGKPTVENTYDNVLKKDKYWPEAANLFNRDYVPERGKKPKKTAVNAFLRFGSGTITAGRLSTVQWKFIRNDGKTYINYFAEEVVYKGFGHSGETIVIELYDLFTDQLLRTLTFSSALPDVDTTLTLFIGNNTKAGIVDALNRASDEKAQPKDGSHVAYLNAVADPDVSPYAPIPQAVPQPVGTGSGSGHPTEHPGGGGSDGFCGPGSANG
jgi:hypothetical protein